MAVGRRYPLDGIDLDALMLDKEVGVRVCGAILHWRKNKQATGVVPVLIEALDQIDISPITMPNSSERPDGFGRNWSGGAGCRRGFGGFGARSESDCCRVGQ